MDTEKKNYYDVLEIETNSTPAQIEQAYLRARNAYSLDSVALYSLITKEECNSILNSVEEAYSILGFPEKRKEYDRFRGFNQDRLGLPSKTAEKSFKGKEVQYEDFTSNLSESRVSKISAQQKFALEYEQNGPMDRKINECVEFTGQFLKQIREYKNVPIERMAELTRISKTHLNAIENEDLTKLPAEVYVRGYVYQYAKVLKLNPENVAASFILHFKKLKIQK